MPEAEGWYDSLKAETAAFARQSDLSDGATIALHQLVRRAIVLERRRCSVKGRLAQLECKLVDEEILKEPT